MRNAMLGSHWSDNIPLAFETGLDETVEFRVPEQSAMSCRFSLGEHSELVLEINGFVAGEAIAPIDLEASVESLLGRLAEEPAASPEEEVEDIDALKSLAQRFRQAAARLYEEAIKREEEIFRA